MAYSTTKTPDIPSFEAVMLNTSRLSDAQFDTLYPEGLNGRETIALARSVIRYAVEETRRIAYTDELTGLRNRASYAYEAPGRARALAQETLSERTYDTYMYFIDLDGFKCVNDTLGHAEGDAVLARVGSKLRAITRAEDVVIRWGGDEFVALCSHKPRPESTASDLDPAPFIGYRMVEELSFSHRHGDLGDFPISASIGAVKLETEALCFLAHPDDRIVRGVLDSLIKSADKAMYCAKQSGKSQLVLAR